MVVACQICGFETTSHLQSHHIIPRLDAVDKIYEINNGATLCKECHKSTFRSEYDFVAIPTEKIERRVMS